jgi:outer membrane protein assembly factor BamB
MIARSRLLGLAIVGLGLLWVLPSAALASAPVAAGHVAAAPALSPLGHNGNLLITDQFNNRVIEVNPSTGNIVWSFGTGNPNTCRPGPHSVIAPNAAVRIGSNFVLIAGTGTGACPDNRVIVVDHLGNIVWTYGKAAVAGSGFDQLNVPVFAVQLPNHHILITDQANNRIIEVNLAHQIVWTYGPTSGSGALNAPNSAERLSNGDTLIADELNNRVIEVSSTGGLVWSDSTGLNTVASAYRLPNGDTLLADAGNSRAVEVNSTGSVVWQYVTNGSASSNPAPQPTDAVRLSNGHTVIADQFNDRVIVVDSTGNLLYQYGQTNVVGNGSNQLNGPYSAVVLGDLTGQDVPPSTFR